MRKIGEYIVVSDRHLAKFTEDVNAKLKEGWELYGSLCTIYYECIGNIFSQALIKYEESDNPTNS